MKAKNLFRYLIVSAIAFILLFTLLLSACKIQNKPGASSTAESSQLSETSLAETTGTGYATLTETTLEQINSPENTGNENQADFQKPVSFISKEAGFSMDYPSDIVTFSTNPYVNASGNDILLSVQINKIDELGEQTLGYDKATALKDQGELKNGQFGEDIDFPFEASKKVLKIKDIYAKGFVVFRRLEVCDVVFERKLIFYNNGYQVVITLETGKDKIIQSMPDFFGIDKENCGDLLTWKRQDGKSSQDEFYKALVSKSASGMAQDWYDTFDLIAGTIKINTGELASVSAKIGFSNIRKSETNKKYNYYFLNSYPEFVNISNLPADEISNINSGIIAVTKPIENSFKKDMTTYGIPSATDERNYVNYYQGDYSISIANENIISLVYEVYTYTGGAHGSTTQYTFNFDIDNNKEIKLADLFKPGFDYLKFISDFCLKDLERQMKSMGMTGDDLFKEGASPDAGNFGCFVLTDDSLIIKFGQYQVAAYAAGMFDVKIPYSEFGDNINPESVVIKLVN
ncbi:MAG: DUF3298 domain-containing protein [Actinobacteria bacterium]|nr:DUF3298 domain-containing protein [Actinomycetota bacterium]